MSWADLGLPDAPGPSGNETPAPRPRKEPKPPKEAKPPKTPARGPSVEPASA